MVHLAAEAGALHLEAAAELGMPPVERQLEAYGGLDLRNSQLELRGGVELLQSLPSSL